MDQQKLLRLVWNLRKPIMERKQLLYQLFEKEATKKLWHILEGIDDTQWNALGEDVIKENVVTGLIAVLSTFGAAKRTHKVFEDVESLSAIRRALMDINFAANSGQLRNAGDLAVKTSEIISSLDKDISALQMWRNNIHI